MLKKLNDTLLNPVLSPVTIAFTLATMSLSSSSTHAVAEEDAREERIIDPTGLWKVNRFDIVVSIEECDTEEYCPTIHWIAEGETDVYGYFGPGKKERNERGIKEPTRDNILELCGSPLNFKIEPAGDNPTKRKGVVHISGWDMWANMTLHLTDENTAKVNISKFIFSEKDTWNRIPPEQHKKYQRCTPPKRPQP